MHIDEIFARDLIMLGLNKDIVLGHLNNPIKLEDQVVIDVELLQNSEFKRACLKFLTKEWVGFLDV